MGMPKKGSKSLSLDNVYYRYTVRTVSCIDRDDDKEILLTVQQCAKKPGNVMQARYHYASAITPAFVCREIYRALKSGWDPSKRGAAFELTKE